MNRRIRLLGIPLGCVASIVVLSRVARGEATPTGTPTSTPTSTATQTATSTQTPTPAMCCQYDKACGVPAWVSGTPRCTTPGVAPVPNADCKGGVCVSIPATATPATPTPTPTPDDGTRSFAGLRLGVGLSVSFDLGQHDRIDTVNLVGDDKTVQVDKEANVEPRVMLESHYFFSPECFPFGVKKKNGDCPPYAAEVMKGRYGVGPFVGIQPGGSEVIETIGLGLMMGFRSCDEEKKSCSKSSWNLGVGAVWDPSVKILRDGVMEGQPLDTRFTSPTKETDQTGLLLMVSFSYDLLQ